MDQKYNVLRFWCLTLAAFIGAACVFTTITTWRALESRLQAVADSALFGAEHLVTRSAANLEKLDVLRASECTDAAVAALKDAVYSSVLPVREIGVIRNRKLFCTNFGPTEIQLTPDVVALTPGTQVVLGVNAVVPGNRSLFIYRVLEKGSATNAVINAPILGEFERGFDFSGVGQLRLIYNDEKSFAASGLSSNVIYEIGQTQLDMRQAYWRTGAASKIYPIAAEIVVTPSAYWAQWRSGFPSTLLAFALLGIVAGLLATRWIRRGGPARLRYQRAITRKEFVMYYQPIVSAQTKKIVGVEALLRWQHPKAGLLRATEFAPIFDDCELLQPLTDYVLHSAARDVKQLEAVSDNVWCSINIPTQIFEGAQLINTVTALIKKIPARRLRLEITERSPMTAAAEQSVREIRSLGVAVGMDDIGTGHSNLDQLQRLEYDFIKIDGLLVRGISTIDSISPVLLSLIALGKQINTQIIAEGVETQTQADALTRAGVQDLQGYLYGRAEPIDAIVEKIRAQDSA